tara:strand:+ start:5014 stop:6420 length:1407 start_codon:yes stop_codon:yes gene_type:complete
MASSFTTNYGIEKITTGEQSGTWGTTTNYNVDILDRIAAYVSIALSNASTATLTVRAGSPTDGANNAQNGMYRVIKFTGTLSQNCTVTIAPATTSAFFMIQNATTGGYSVIMAQGSAAQTVSVPSTKAQIIYADASDEVISISDKFNVQNFGNISISGNTISSTNTNGDIDITPNGNGNIQLESDLIYLGGGSEEGHLSSNGAYDLLLETNSGTNSGFIRIVDGVNGDVRVEPNGTGEFSVGNGAASGKITSKGAFDLELDTNNGTNSGSIKITDAANGAIDLAPNGTGTVVVKGNTNPGSVVFNCESNTHGQTVKAQPHSATVTNILTLPAGGNQEIVGTTAIQTLASKQLKDYAETVYANGSKTAAFDLDLDNGNVQSFTVGSGTFNVGITNSLASQSNSMTIILTNGGAGTITFKAGANGGGGANVKYAGGTAPTLTSSGIDILTFTTFDGGTTYFGFAAGLAMA